MGSKEKVFVALDVNSIEKARYLVDLLEPHVAGFKFGFEFITMLISSLLVPVHDEAMHNAEKIRNLILRLSGKIFWDCKFNDIPNTVGAASAILGAMMIKLFNLHAASGIPAMKKAVEKKGGAEVFAVTILTSLDEALSNHIFGAPVKNKVLQLAEDALEAGCDGIVCSPLEIEMIRGRSDLGKLKIITPGVRPPWYPAKDQKRTLTPREAILAGADYLVIGRPITDPPPEIGSPVEAVQRIDEEIEST